MNQLLMTLVHPFKIYQFYNEQSNIVYNINTMNTKWKNLSLQQRANTRLTSEYFISNNIINEENLITTTSDNFYTILTEKFKNNVNAIEWSYYENKTHFFNTFFNKQEQISLFPIYTFLKYGLALYNNCIPVSKIHDLKDIYNVAMKILNRNANSRALLQSTVSAKTIRNYTDEHKNYSEFIYRTNTNNTFDSCTLDISLKSESLLNEDIRDIFEESKCVQDLKLFYKKLDLELNIKNWGFFGSPKGNPGQELHCDDEYMSLTQKFTYVPSMVTVLIAVTQQKAKKIDTKTSRTTGCTKFILKSMHPIAHLFKDLYLWKINNITNPFKYLQLILNTGDVIAFGGNILHAGGKFDYEESSTERILAYGVYQIEGKYKENHPNQCTCWKCRESYVNFLNRDHLITKDSNEIYVCLNKKGEEISH